MLARFQQITVFSLVIAAAAWAIYFFRSGQLMWAWVGVLLILLGYALFLAVEFVMLAFTQTGDPAQRASARQLLGAWWGEVLTAPQVFCWRQPFRSHAEPDFVPPQATGMRGVVLVHGFFCNRALWNPWMAKLRLAQVPFVAVNLEPLFGSIDNYVGTVDQAVRRLQSATGQAPVMVAHSMGGLAARAWLSNSANDARVHRVVTIGTPHHGTWLAHFGHTVNGKQMRISSPWLSQLARSEPPKRYAKFTCFYSHCDNIVFPASTATLPGASNRHVPGTAHVDLAFQEVAFDEVVRWVMAQSPETIDSESPGAATTACASGEHPSPHRGRGVRTTRP